MERISKSWCQLKASKRKTLMAQSCRVSLCSLTLHQRLRFRSKSLSKQLAQASKTWRKAKVKILSQVVSKPQSRRSSANWNKARNQAGAKSPRTALLCHI